MKNVLCIVSILLLAPFLVCDPDPAVTEYLVNLNGQGWVSTPAPLHYDLSDVNAGAHTIEVKAKNEWGQSVSVPFDFTKILPSVSNIRIATE